MSICYTCHQYKSIELFGTYNRIPNSRCKDCVVQAHNELLNNRFPVKNYIVFLHPQEKSKQYIPLVNFYGEIKSAGIKIEHEAAVPYVPLAKLSTKDIKSFNDRLLQIVKSNLSNISSDKLFEIEPDLSDDWKSFYYKFKFQNKMERLLKEVQLNFPTTSTRVQRRMIFFDEIDKKASMKLLKKAPLVMSTPKAPS